MTNSRASRALNRQVTFVFLALLVNLCASLAAHRIGSRNVEIAAAFDMTVTVTGLYYLMVVRPGIRPRSSMILIAALGLFRVSLAFPNLIPGRFWIAAGAECAVLFFARRILLAELSVFYYALAWWAKPEVPQGAATFTLHKRSGFGDLLLCVGLASPVEILPMHMVLHRWSPTAAWITTVLGLYSALWCIAVARSLNLRPGYAAAGGTVIRFGLLFSLQIPHESIATVGPEVRPGIRVIPRNAAPNICIEFTHPLEAQWMFGIRRPVSAIALAADDPDQLLRTLRS